MTVTVNAGFAICGSCLKLEEAARTLTVQASNAVHDRIDTVVLRLNTNDDARYCDLYVVQGVATASPVRPALTRTSTVWELGLADIFVSKGSGAISEARITDTRYDTERCGVISSVSQFDTTTIYQQVQADLAEFKDEEQADFLAWYEQMQGVLSEDVAVNLQNQIDAINDNLTATISTSFYNDVDLFGTSVANDAIIKYREMIENNTYMYPTFITHYGSVDGRYYHFMLFGETKTTFNVIDLAGFEAIYRYVDGKWYRYNYSMSAGDVSELDGITL